jgi:hypothetical protein
MASSMASRSFLPSVTTRGRSTSLARMRLSLPVVNLAGYVKADIDSPLQVMRIDIQIPAHLRQ